MPEPVVIRRSTARAQVLRDYYGRSADAFTTSGDSECARVCMEAEVTVRQALRAGWAVVTALSQAPSAWA